mmetsp:Transcript_52060/g.113780  ORF Transcript_52060/g.113780 Transcript_52060/m.113780 type:complete len:217 (-) Transcript_52060:1817-2467(-)
MTGARRRRPTNAAAAIMPSSSVGATGHLPPLRGQSEQANITGLSGWRHLLLAGMPTCSPASAATAIGASAVTSLPSMPALLTIFMSSSPFTFSLSSSASASMSMRYMFSLSRNLPRASCSSTILFTSASTFLRRVCETGGAPPPPMKSRPMKGPPPPCDSPMTRWPTTSDMPSCVTMALAICVHCWKSFEAPVVTLATPLMISSAIRPPSATHMRF